MNNYVYIVMHNQGIDGSYIEAVFSNYKDAQTLCEMYSKTDDFDNEYNFFAVNKVKINSKNLIDYKIVGDEYKQLEYQGETIL